MDATAKKLEQQQAAQLLKESKRTVGNDEIDQLELEQQEDAIEILKIEEQPPSLIGGTLRDY